MKHIKQHNHENVWTLPTIAILIFEIYVNVSRYFPINNAATSLETSAFKMGKKWDVPKVPKK